MEKICHENIYFGTLKEDTFAVQKNREIFTFRGNKLSRMKSYEKFRGNKLSRWTTFKRFPGNKKRPKSKFMRRNIRFYCTVIQVGHLTCVKIAKKEFQKTCFPLFFLSWVLNFWNFTNATIIWYHNYKSVFFSEYSQMTTFLENFADDVFWKITRE